MKIRMALLLFSAALCAQPVPQEQIDEAVRKGVAYLEAQGLHSELFGCPAEALYALTLADSGVLADQEPLAGLLQKLASSDSTHTYDLALRAMAFLVSDPKKYRAALVECGQRLVDLQLSNGQWTYGQNQSLPDRVAVPTEDAEGKIRLRPQTVAMPQTGDDSNSQFGILGLWAVSQAGIEVPMEAWTRAEHWWKGSQRSDGGWGYYTGQEGDSSYGAMTCAGIAALRVCAAAIGAPARNDNEIKRGLEWLGGRFSVDRHPAVLASNVWRSLGQKDDMLYYYLYSLERAGTLGGADRIGGHDWYQEGARYLVDRQKADGSWVGGGTYWGAREDTCFAILFLKRATRFLITQSPLDRASVTPDDPASESADPAEPKK